MPRRSKQVVSLPKTFKVFDHTCHIKPTPGLMEKQHAFGMWVEKDLTMYIDTDTPESLVVHTLWHEIMHAVLDLTGHSKLSHNERFVDCMGGALAQVIKTLK